MALSLNWKALQQKLPVTKTKKTRKVTNEKRKLCSPQTQHDPQKRPVDKEAMTVTLTPLEYALWTTPLNGSFKITQAGTISPNEFGDPRKAAAGKFLAIDCEFVGVGSDDRSVLARVSIVNYFGVIIYDTFVRPAGRVTNWRTRYSGVAPRDVRLAPLFDVVQQKVKEIIENKILVGHAINNDFKCLGLKVSSLLIRDTSMLPEYRDLANGKPPSLKKLCKHFLQLDIQSGPHSSVEDARATMALYRLRQNSFNDKFR